MVVIETEGLTHVQLVVRDVHRSLAFYEAVFGMEVRFWDGDRMVFIGTPGRRDTITLNQSDDVERAGAAGGVITSGSGYSINAASTTRSQS